jgi:hypothetical protein
MRKHIMGFIGIIALLMLQGCASYATNIGNNTFQSSDKTYTIKMRSGWDVITGLSGKFTMTIHKDRTLLLGNTIKNVSISDGKMTELADTLNTRYARSMHGEITQSEIMTTSRGNLRYIKGTGSGETDKGTPVLYSTFVIAGNKHLYILFVTGEEESYIDEQQIINQIPDNFNEL